MDSVYLETAVIGQMAEKPALSLVSFLTHQVWSYDPGEHLRC